MCFSGNSLKALVVKDKTRSAQSWRALLNCTWAVSGSSLNPNRFSILEENPKPLEDMDEGERGPRGRGKSVSLPMSLKFDGKSNWKVFYVKFSSYA
jgi:hypothetical protein